MNKTVLIVGTGLGGLCTGLRLLSNGYKVSFVEKGDKPGGRLNQIKEAGFTFDVGPSFFSMPYEFEELMKDCGLTMPFEFVELDPLYTVNMRGSDRKYILYKDIDKLSEQFEDVEPDFKTKFKAYLKKCEELYNDTVDIVVKRNFDTLQDYLKSLMTVNPKHLPVLVKTFWQQSSSFFDSKEVQQIVSLIAFFLGRTPFDTNAVYTLLSHVEFTHTGYYNVKGGMYTIVTSLVEELKNMGATFEYNTEITGYKAEGGTLKALVDQSDKDWTSELFVINSDAAYFRGKVFGRKNYSEKKLRKMSWTMGYLTFYVGLKTKLPQVEHHNYFLGNNYKEYAGDVMSSRGTMEKPYYYVNVLSKHNADCAPEGCEALFFVCPSPNLLYKDDWSDKQEIVDSILSDFGQRIGQDISRDIVYEKIYTPEDWHERLNLFAGAGLGLSHSMLQVGWFRPKNIDEQFSNVFYVGASTVPGAGLPMAVISSKLTTQRVFEYGATFINDSHS